jgi:pyrroloquinoline-quinone synthase
VSLWKRLEEVSDRHSVLRHPFYVRWSEGTLTRAELADYSGQYRHAVVALADAAASAASSPEAGADASALAQHAAEEAAHVALWDEFVAAAGGQVDAEPTAETRECAAEWAGDGYRPLLETLIALYAIESAQPAISATKRAGLLRHYGIATTEYFDVHERLDVEHAAQARAHIDRRIAHVDEDALVATGERVLVGNWRLLDGVQRHRADLDFATPRS